MAGLRRALLPTFFLLGAAASLLVFARDRAERRPSTAFEKRYAFPERHAVWVETAELAPSADIGVDALATASLRDALEQRRWSDLTSDERQAWLAAIAHLDEQLRDTRELLLDAIRSRPGWAYHRLLLGEVAFVARRRTFDPRLGASAEEWITPLRLAQAAAPGEEAVAPFLAGALLESWQLLPESARAELPRILPRAFADDAFVARALPAARAAIGEEAATSLIPSRPRSLRSARDALLGAGMVESAARLDARWEMAERRARADDLAAVRKAGERGDAAARKELCRAYVGAHPPRSLDGPAERRALGEVLSFWPPDDFGAFRGDPRGELVRFFAEGHLEDAPPAALANALAALSETPDHYRALGRLLAGDVAGVRSEIVASDAKGALAWTPVFLAWTRIALRGERRDEAIEAFGHISTLARGECDSLLAARDLAKADGDATSLQRAEKALAARRQEPLVASAGAIPLCVDPLTDGGAHLAVRVKATAPTLLAWGFRGARRGARLVPPGESVLDVPLEGERGLTAVTIQPMGAAAFELREASWSARPAATPAPATTESVTATAGMERLKSTTP